MFMILKVLFLLLELMMRWLELIFSVLFRLLVIRLLMFLDIFFRGDELMRC